MLGYFDLKLIVCNEACGSLDRAKLYAGIDKGPHEKKRAQDGSY